MIPGQKAKNAPALNIVITGRGCLLGLLMFVLGLLGGITGTAMTLPGLWGISATQTAFWAQAHSTSTTLGERAEHFARAQQTEAAQATLWAQWAEWAAGTQSGVWEARLQQTATQMASSVLATQTATSVVNAEALTQVALDYAATQAQVQMQATQIELNFQATRAVLDGVLPPAPTVTPTSTPLITRTPAPGAGG